MPEILTESFCERCGTRYTFESAAPTGKRMGKIKVLSKGLKKFVMDDDSSLDEALQEARSETDRETSSQQLDAFHQTFNFCMSCRQYTCANCWNDAVGRCLTCVPLADDFLERPFARLRPAGSPNGHPAAGAEAPRADALAWPTTDLRREEPEPEIVQPVVAAQPAPKLAQPAKPVPAPQAAARVAPQQAATKPAPPPAAEPPIKRRSGRAARSDELLAKFQPGQSLDAALEAFEATLDEEVSPESGIRERLAAATEPAPRSQPAPKAAPPGKLAPVARPEPPVVAWEPELIPIHPVAATPDPEPEPIAAVGEPEADAPETGPSWADVPGTTPDPVAAGWEEPLEAPALDAAEADLEMEWAAREAGVEWPAADLEPHAEPIAAESEPVAAQPESVFPEPEPAAIEPSRGQPAATPRAADDRVEVPTWRIVAPEPPAPRPRSPRSGPRREVPASPPVAADSAVRTGSPEWPGQPATDSLAFLAKRDAATGMDAVWAASTRDLLSTPPVAPAPAASTGIQGCVSCGLSLSATARFCRRCGTQQG